MGDYISLFIQLLADFNSFQLKNQGPIFLLSSENSAQLLEPAYIPWFVAPPPSSEPTIGGQIPLKPESFSAASSVFPTS